MNEKARKALLETLQARFEKHRSRHERVDWSDVLAKLDVHPDKLRSLAAMEESGGEPDVVVLDAKSHDIVFADCSAESPAGRRSLCYDREAFEARREHRPAGSAVDSATAMGIELLTEAQYRALQALGEFDLKTSSWIATPAAIRQRGGALFCDRRYDHVFVYHNGAQSYYAARGFRGLLRIG